LNRYRPCVSLTAVICGTCNAGLVSVNVTPGSTPPVSSVTVPSMAPKVVVVCAVEERGAPAIAASSNPTRTGVQTQKRGDVRPSDMSKTPSLRQKINANGCDREAMLQSA
jgi:hypothetical protein